MIGPLSKEKGKGEEDGGAGKGRKLFPWVRERNETCFLLGSGDWLEGRAPGREAVFPSSPLQPMGGLPHPMWKVKRRLVGRKGRRKTSQSPSLQWQGKKGKYAKEETAYHSIYRFKVTNSHGKTSKEKTGMTPSLTIYLPPPGGKERQKPWPL